MNAANIACRGMKRLTADVKEAKEVKSHTCSILNSLTSTNFSPAPLLSALQICRPLASVVLQIAKLMPKMSLAGIQTSLSADLGDFQDRCSDLTWLEKSA